MNLTKNLRGSYHTNLMVFTLSTSNGSIGLKLFLIHHNTNQEILNLLQDKHLFIFLPFPHQFLISTESLPLGL